MLARVTPLFFIAPLFSSSLIPPRVRGIIAVGISIGLTPIAMHGQHMPSEPLPLAELVIEGLLVGFGFAFTLSVLMAAIESAGAMIDVVSGFSYGELINPMNGAERRRHVALLLAGRDADLPGHRRRRVDAARARAHLPARPADQRPAHVFAGGRRRAGVRRRVHLGARRSPARCWWRC